MYRIHIVGTEEYFSPNHKPFWYCDRRVKTALYNLSSKYKDLEVIKYNVHYEAIARWSPEAFNEYSLFTRLEKQRLKRDIWLKIDRMNNEELSWIYENLIKRPTLKKS